MYVEINLALDRPSPQLADADNFREFKIAFDGARDDARARVAIAGIGQLVSPDHALVRVDALVALAGPRAADHGWRRNLDSMIGYAREHGWLDDTETMIRAHCEWTAEE